MCLGVGEEGEAGGWGRCGCRAGEWGAGSELVCWCRLLVLPVGGVRTCQLLWAGVVRECGRAGGAREAGSGRFRTGGMGAGVWEGRGGGLALVWGRAVRTVGLDIHLRWRELRWRE
ncbi:hypothetical protein Stube_52500 [Streptomyces tubercidicus]|uniref:Uncharacterized protein n=1 Tax=Streptomyces tubercidicus TaxID=47759 RepID=A0A640UYR1_9ACTN|nr:hypothetical protein Stube_52500 [Streptomyces tubercidicus]